MRRWLIDFRIDNRPGRWIRGHSVGLGSAGSAPGYSGGETCTFRAAVDGGVGFIRARALARRAALDRSQRR
jgi:hypothetical protein